MAKLHLGRSGDQDAQANAARAQHGVLLAQTFDTLQISLFDTTRQRFIDLAQRVEVLQLHLQVGQTLDQFLMEGRTRAKAGRSGG